MAKTDTRTKTIRVDYLARVEGEGAFHVKVTDGAVTDARPIRTRRKD